ncbi:MAG: conserved exported protein of unknown function [Nitrospira sp.]|nr:MAG: conserved exported protein of unknown function [Nitrospira sp.]
MTRTTVLGFSLTVLLALAGCETDQALLQKSAQEQDLRNETTVGTHLPPGCPTQTASFPAGQPTFTASYQEPAVDQKGAPLTDLAFTTIYISAAETPTTAMRVWTNDAHGGASVTVHDIPLPARNIGLCVTATNWSRKESGPAPVQPPQAPR